MLQDMTELPQKPHMLQHWPNLEPAQVWPPFLEPHRPAELTLDVDVGFVAEAVEVLEVFTVEEVAMLEGADDTLIGKCRRCQRPSCIQCRSSR